MKKGLLSIIALSMAMTTLLSVGCNGKNEPTPESGDDVVIEKLELDENAIVMTIGDEMELGVSYNEIAGGILNWTSTNPNVVAVDANGKIQAKNVGQATVKVTYGTKTASCKVEVSTNGYLPVLTFDNDVDVENGVSVLKNSTFALGTHIVFNGKKFDDGEFDYSVSDPTVGTVVNGEFVAGDKTGETVVSVYATWRNQVASSKSLKIKVIADKTVILDDGDTKDFQLYTASEHEGVTYETTKTVKKISITEDGVPVENYTVSVLDTNIATAEKTAEGVKISALKVGKTYVMVSYNGIDGKTDVAFSLKVDYPVATYETKLAFSVADGKVFDETTGTMKTVNDLFDGFGDITTMKVGGKEYSVTDNVLSAVKEGKEQTVTVYNGNVGYEFTTDAYTLVIDELKDFEYIYAGQEGNLVTGNFILAKDLVEPETVLSMPEGKTPNDFGGTFDGQGHVLSFTLNRGEVGKFGLFGNILCGATIKNVALDNVTIDGSKSTVKVAGVICSEPSQSANKTYGTTTLENVYVNVKFSEPGVVNMAFMGNVQWNTVLRNVIIVCNDVPVGTQYGAFARGATAKTTDSYVISNSTMYYTSDNPDLKFTPIPELLTSYASLAGKDISSFSDVYWDLTTGVPVWRAIASSFNLE